MIAFSRRTSIFLWKKVPSRLIISRSVQHFRAAVEATVPRYFGEQLHVPFACLAATSVSIGVSVALSQESDDHAKLSFDAAVRELRSLSQFRQSLYAKTGIHAPLITLKISPAPDDSSVSVLSVTVPAPYQSNVVDVWKSITSHQKKTGRDDSSFQSFFRNESQYFVYYRDEGFTKKDVENVIKFYESIWGNIDAKTMDEMKKRQPNCKDKDYKKAVNALNNLGVTVFEKSENSKLDWECLAGYDDTKAEIESTLVQALKYPEKYDDVARHTRKYFETNRPRAILLSGPPGTGKTLTARIIANRSNRPMVHVSIESVVSKWYGESEQKLAQIFELCEKMGGAIIFIDEIDSLAGSRDLSMNEATRRLLSVLLRKLDGFEGRLKSVLIAATNRREDLDAAMLSRFDLTIPFNLPNKSSRAAIFALYAKHLSNDDREHLASLSENMSCRDIREACEVTERRWAGEIIEKKVTKSAPDVEAYEKSVLNSRFSATQKNVTYRGSLPSITSQA